MSENLIVDDGDVVGLTLERTPPVVPMLGGQDVRRRVDIAAVHAVGGPEAKEERPLIHPQHGSPRPYGLLDVRREPREALLDVHRCDEALPILVGRQREVVVAHRFSHELLVLVVERLRLGRQGLVLLVPLIERCAGQPSGDGEHPENDAARHVAIIADSATAPARGVSSARPGSARRRCGRQGSGRTGSIARPRPIDALADPLTQLVPQLATGPGREEQPEPASHSQSGAEDAERGQQIIDRAPSGPPAQGSGAGLLSCCRNRGLQRST